MRSKVMRAAVIACVFAFFASTGNALAVDPPKWVAALHIEAQKVNGLRWAPVAGATAYKVLRSVSKGKDYAEVAAPTVPQFLDSAIEPATTYFYVLQAVSGAEVSANSDERSVLVSGKKVEVLVGLKWKEVTLNQTIEFGKPIFKVGLFWERGKSANIVAFNIYRSLVSGKDYELIGSTQEPQYVDSAVVADKTYYYVVSATDSSFMESPMSEEKSITPKVVEQEKAKAKDKETKNTIKVRKTKIAMIINDLEIKYQFESLMDFVYHPDEDLVYVVDAGKKKIVAFDMDGEVALTFGEPGRSPGKFDTPWAISLNSDGQLVVTDVNRKAIMLFKPKGDFVREFLVDTKLDPVADVKDPLPTGAIELKNGDYLVADNANTHLLRFDDKGKMIGGFGKPADAKNRSLGYLGALAGLATDETGRIYVQDYGGDYIQVFDDAGKPLYGIGNGVKGLVGSFVKPGKPFYDAKNKELVVPDGAMANIQSFDVNNNGAYVSTFTGETGALKFEERADWQLGSTRNVTRDNRGRYWVLMGLDKKLAVLAPIE